MWWVLGLSNRWLDGLCFVVNGEMRIMAASMKMVEPVERSEKVWRVWNFA